MSEEPVKNARLRARRVSFTLGGRPVSYLGPSSDGAVVGVLLDDHPELARVHETILLKGNLLSSHITDERSGKKEWQNLPRLSRPEAILLAKRLSRHLQPYMSNSVAWLPSGSLEAKLAALAPRVGTKRRVRIPLDEFLSDKSTFNFRNPKLWRKVKVRELAEERKAGYWRRGPTVYVVLAVPGDNKMLKMPVESFGPTMFALFRHAGLDLISYPRFINQQIRSKHKAIHRK